MLFDLDGTLWHFDEVPSPETIAQALAPRIKAVVAGWGERSLTPYADLDLALFGAQTEALREAEAGDLREPDLDRVFIGELGRHDIRADAPQSRELRLAMWPDPAIVGQRMIEGAVETLPPPPFSRDETGGRDKPVGRRLRAAPRARLSRRRQPLRYGPCG